MKPKLLKTIWAVARERGISAEEVHDAVMAGFGKESLKQLGDREAYQLIDGLRGKKSGQRRDWMRGQAQAYAGRKKDAVDDPAYLVNEIELRMLGKMAAARGWDQEALEKFCVRQIGVAVPRMMKEFNKVFWALKSMARRDAKRPLQEAI